MTKSLTLAISLAALALTLATPGVTHAGWRSRGCCEYVPCCTGYYINCTHYYGCCETYVPCYRHRYCNGFDVSACYTTYGACCGATPVTYALPAYAAAPTIPANTASVRVIVPADAHVWVDGVGMTLTGTNRVFASPSLTSGKDFGYDIKAEWPTEDGTFVTSTRHVIVRANASTEVDFTAPLAE